MLTAERAKTGPSNHLLEGDVHAFREQFNRTPFLLSHTLASNPLFQLNRLLELTKTTLRDRPTDVVYNAGDVKVEHRFRDAPPKVFSVEEALQRIETAGAWIVLKRADQDPEYRAILEQCLSEAQGLIGKDLRSQMRVQEAIIFITSPNRITNYHVDRECNFILQIHGEKTLYVFDQNDRDVLPEAEIERFWTVDNNAGEYKPQYQDRAKTFQLAPGNGVHVPVNAPHWLKNGNNISITLSVNFQFNDGVRANLYRANYVIRKLRMTPVPPFQSPARDAVKRAILGVAWPSRKLVKWALKWAIPD